MARKPTGKPTGRPPKDFNKQIFENLCQIQCTVKELESVLNTDSRTLDSWCKREYGENFSVTYKRFAESGKPSLRRYQWNLAKTNASMGIWLGKQYLDQKDHKDEQFVDEQTIAQFSLLMKQIGDIQSARKIEDSKISKEQKS